MNIIVKNNNPSWRPFTETTGHFNSLHKKDNSKVDPSLPVESQFSKEELARIHNAVHFTQQIIGNTGVLSAQDIQDEI